MLKNRLFLCAALILTFALLLSGCTPTTTPNTPATPSTTGTDKEPVYRDGVYSARSDTDSNGWQDTVEVTITNGKVAAVDWDAVWVKDDTITVSKKEYSAAGDYGMKEKGGSLADWHEEAKAAEDYVIANNGTAGIKLIESGDKTGKTDSISGATVHVSEFVKLVNVVLEDAKA